MRADTKIRKKFDLKPGQVLSWQAVSPTELRVVLGSRSQPSHPRTLLGYARRFKASKNAQSSDQVLKALREGEEE